MWNTRLLPLSYQPSSNHQPPEKHRGVLQREGGRMPEHFHIIFLCAYACACYLIPFPFPISFLPSPLILIDLQTTVVLLLCPRREKLRKCTTLTKPIRSASQYTK